MLMILVAALSAAGLGIFLLTRGTRDFEWTGLLSVLSGTFLCIGAGFTLIIYAFVAFDWFAAAHKAEIINREYETNYTQAEVFWASDVIDTVRQLDRKRIELNGDLMRGDEESPN